MRLGANYAMFKWPLEGTLLQHALLNSCGRGKFEFQHCTRSRIVKSENIRKINLKHIVTLKHMIAKRIILVVFEIQHDADMGALHI